ncbi:hypothetical protein V1517DRAFT_348194 [Lipomyces orientalis]|uniref:Uncharacterized protein n=1 Tax=Lipomyces orientalis TaxID=1233043 RepID=A0ACC3THS6_9ASCO
MSRLDRLVSLLDTGSTQLVRNTAADQIADVQKAHPDELYNLLGRVFPYLRSQKWDTRVAAARALGGIADNTERWDPNANAFKAEDANIKEEDEVVDVKLEEEPPGNVKEEKGRPAPPTKTPSFYPPLPLASEFIKKEEDLSDIKDGLAKITTESLKVSSGGLSSPDEDEGLLNFATLDIGTVLKNGMKLLGSGGREYDFSLADLDPAERLALQKRNVTARLGLGGEYMEDIVTAQDFAPQTPGAKTPGVPPTPGQVQYSQSYGVQPLKTPDAQSPADDNSGLSSRVRAMAKRKARADAKNQSNRVRSVDLSSSTASRKLASVEALTPADKPTQAQDYFSVTPQAQPDRVVVEHKAPPNPSSAIQSAAAGQVWPFEGLAELLMVDLFDEAWETRHGAASGLREIIRVHGAGAGRIVGKPQKVNDRLNKTWLEDLACRICCVFALDRFGDFVSDQVVAPIRESVAQTLGALLLHLPKDTVLSTYKVLYDLVMQNNFDISFPIWEACHGGMLGLRYLVAVRKDLLFDDDSEGGLLDGVVECVMHGLDEQDDDVRAVSAATLVPIASEFVVLRPRSVDKLIEVVWDCLANLKDDLSASTGSVMDLLAKLCSFPQVLEQMKVNAMTDSSMSFAMLVPRLYPFLRHSISSVRRAVLRALLTFLNIEGEGASEWVDGKALRLVFQNLLVEQNEGVLNLSLEVFKALSDNLSNQGETKFAEAFSSHVSPLLTLLMTPIGVNRNSFPMDTSLFLRPSGATFAALNPATTTATAIVHNGLSNGASDGPPPKRRRRSEKKEEPLVTTHNIDSPVLLGDVELIGMEAMIRMKIAGAKATGYAMGLWPDSNIMTFQNVLESYLGSASMPVSPTAPYSTSRLIAAMILEEYGSHVKGPSDLKSYFGPILSDILNAVTADIIYQDVAPYLKVVRTQAQALLNVFVDVGRVSPHKLPRLAVVVQGEPDAGPDAFGLADAERILGSDIERLRKSMQASYRFAVADPLKHAQDSLRIAIDDAKEAIELRQIRTAAAVAGAYVSLLSSLPKKLNPVIRNLMDCVKEEENFDLQRRSAASVALLVQLCSDHGKIGASDKIIKNLCAFLCVDTAEVPEFHLHEKLENAILSLRKEEDRRDPKDLIAYQREAKKARTKRRGAKTSLEILAEMFGPNLFEKVPKLKECMISPLLALKEPLPGDIKSPESTLGQEIVDGLSVFRALLPKLHSDLHDIFVEYFKLMATALESIFSVLRYAAAKCFATVCSVMKVKGMTFLVENILPMFNNALDLKCRQGAVECVYHLVHVMEAGILPYVVFLIVPILGRMSDSDNDIRLLATTTFAQLIKLVPLEAGIPDPPGLPPSLLEGRDRERKFISQMLDPGKVESFTLPVAIKADLRKYQQEGVNWLAFLNKYHLHGILCDDMGLGKTLQTICIVASDHHLRAEEHARTHSVETRPLPSLVVCPPTLTGHWQHELHTYAPFLKVLVYVGNPYQRSGIASQFASADVVITSYDICRNDVDVVTAQNWCYCVLDEGHIIKNAGSKLTKAVKCVVADHRLILSGTPIQNNVLELWSLFDFLMPGFLGTEKVFNDRFSKPITQSRNSKSSSKEQEAGALALEALHKQVLPFLLRRLKEDVLSDLPPKIIQDYYCDLSDLQKQLYEDFAKKQKKSVQTEVSSTGKENKQHIFQALQYMRKLCDHPALVLNPKHPQYDKVTRQLAAEKRPLRDIAHAPKLGALHALLLDCGIGTNDATTSSITAAVSEDLAAGVISQHRALIFCQLKEMLDIIEHDVFQKLLPTVSYMRLDGSTDARKRQDIVQTFNADPSIDVLLLTTHVGGLGLNLTGADTVIFVEHDWNPMKDLQAMDRAHRIGQKKVVNVYRLITRNTVEEKIMGLQRFKLNIASTIVNQQNAGLSTMDTDQILDLFNIDGDSAAVTTTRHAATADEDMVDEQGQIIKKGDRSAVHGLSDLWDEKEYEEEYNLDSFIQSLK